MGADTLRDKLTAIIDAIFFDVYQNSGLQYTDEMVEIQVDKILQAVSDTECEHDRAWKRYCELVDKQGIGLPPGYC